MKVLNLYAGIGGNRKLWDDVEVTAVEIDPTIAELYQGFFPDDKVVIADAHQYLLDHFREFDFIWASPPCVTHSITNRFLNAQGVIRYPDMRLYQEIIFLKTYAPGFYCVENVKSYYEPLIKPYEIDRHYFWANFHITSMRTDRTFNICNTRDSTRLPNEEYKQLIQESIGFEGVSSQVLRNCVYPPIGKHILDCARDSTQKTLVESINSISKRSGECG